MSLKDWFVILIILALAIVPWLMGWVSGLEAAMILLSTFIGGVVAGWLFLPHEMAMRWESPHTRVGKTTYGLGIHTLKGEEIISRIVARTSFLDNTGKVVTPRLRLAESRFDADRRVYSGIWRNRWFSVHLTLKEEGEGGAFLAEVNTTLVKDPPARFLHHDGRIRLEASFIQLHFPLLMPLHRLYLKNRTVGTRGGLLPVWLDRQGVTLGRGLQSFHLYHAPEISSLRYRRWPHRLTIYTDHAHDHRFAAASATENNPVYTDMSHTPMGVGDRIISSFSFLAGTAPETQPLIWLHPEGHDASLIWTSHPDNSSLASTKAITLGSSDMDPEDTPVGGFCAHQIPMTMAAFFHTDHPNHISLTNHTDSEAYLRLTSRLAREFGFEVIPHAASSHSATDQLTEEALAFFSKHFNNVNWTDHSAHIQRTTLSGNGATCHSDEGIINLLHQNKVKYVWHYGSELKYFTGFTALDDTRGLDLLKTGSPFSSGEHTPLWWRHPARLGKLITWKTSPLGRLRHFPVTGLQWLVWFQQHMPKLLKNHGVAVIHDYPAWVYRKKNLTGNGVYTRKKRQDGELFEIDPLFDRLLADLKHLKESGKVHCNTVNAFLDYQMAMEQISFQYPEKKIVVIKNTASVATSVVLSLPIDACPETMPQKMLFLRQSNTQKLYTLHMDAGEDAAIRFR